MAAKKKTAKKTSTRAPAEKKTVRKRAPKKEIAETNNPDNPIGAIKKLEPIEALRFGKMDAEIRNHLQGIRLADLEISRIRSEANAQIAKQQDQKKLLQIEISRASPQYDAMMLELAERYGISDPKHMVIDPDSGTIRDAAKDL